MLLLLPSSRALVVVVVVAVVLQWLPPRRLESWHWLRPVYTKRRHDRRAGHDHRCGLAGRRQKSARNDGDDGMVVAVMVRLVVVVCRLLGVYYY